MRYCLCLSVSAIRRCIPFPLRCEQSLARLGAEVVGVDPSPENVAVASAHAKGDPLTRTIRYEATTAEDLESRGAVGFVLFYIECQNVPT